MKVLIKSAGDLASGIAVRLHRCGFQVVMTDIPIPTTVRRSVSFSPAVYQGRQKVEDVEGVLCKNLKEIEQALLQDKIAVIVDEKSAIKDEWKPDVLIDAIVCKRNLGTQITDADLVIGVGPGFIAGEDCHCVIESKRGHYLGRCIWEGSAIRNTGIPGTIEGCSEVRILRGSEDGPFRGCVSIGDLVEEGDIVGYCNDAPVYARVSGIVRGLLQDGAPARQGLKVGDVDPRGDKVDFRTISDKATAIGGGVLEAILHWSRI